MASTKTLNAGNLERLGAAPLAALLIEVSAGNAVAQRRLRLALAGNAGADEAARAIGRRLAAVARAGSRIGWRRVGPLVTDLAAQHAAIVEQVAPADPDTAFRLMWRLVSCADGVAARSDDGSGRLSGVFHDAARALGPLAQAAAIDAATLVELAVEAIGEGGHGFGQWDELVDVLAPALGPTGLDRLRDRVAEWRSEADGPRSGGGPARADAVEAGRRRRAASRVLRRIADRCGDVDGYAAHYDEPARAAPAVAAAIARRLLDARRADEAWAAIERVGAEDRRAPPVEWEQARIDALDALGRPDEAQAFRWERFAATLNAAHLRAYLRRLPDFEDFDAEARAMAHALAHDDVDRALGFLIGWPALDRASALVLRRIAALDGGGHEVLEPAADALAHRFPLAATLLLRAMIDATLARGRGARYRHAACHLAEARALAARADGAADVPTHAAYERRLHDVHARKAGFWTAVAACG